MVDTHRGNTQLRGWGVVPVKETDTKLKHLFCFRVNLEAEERLLETRLAGATQPVKEDRKEEHKGRIKWL